ncbi:MAG: hypothetical protein QP733_06925 [Dialister micraerophilus]|uniref:hypothetical protein n=1 Tax=Bacillota TaxID=1239 RepID=UPI002549ED14|nr:MULTISPECIES: hypothetical protein [Bacillota]MDK6688342.1 hypothetical protein [Aerococcus urinae]MDK8254154.1 hypothetical protein [Dialister micraerophilus]
MLNQEQLNVVVQEAMESIPMNAEMIIYDDGSTFYATDYNNRPEEEKDGKVTRVATLDLSLDTWGDMIEDLTGEYYNYDFSVADLDEDTQGDIKDTIEDMIINQ